MPKFSIVIPTRARPDTLIHALRTAVDQTCPDLEILVHECGDDPETAKAVTIAGDRRTRHVKTIQPVSMTENWERALHCATGDYVTFIGDDDGLLPGACTVAAEILARNPSDLLSWRPACYFWPRYLDAGLRNRLMLRLSEADAVEVKNSRIALEMFFRFREDYSRLPMIYNSFVSRGLIDRIRAKAGCYFIGFAPDVTSGIVNAFSTDYFLLSHRPLSSSGLSHNSTGHRMYRSNDESARREAAAQAFSSDAKSAPSRNLTLFLGEEMLKVKQRFFPSGPPELKPRGLFWAAVQSLNDTPAEIETMLPYVRDAALKNGVSIEEWLEPPRQASSAPPQGIRAISSGTLLMDIDCSRAGVSDIHQATRLLDSLLPPVVAPRVITPPEPLRSIDTKSDTALKFDRNGNGLLFLGIGWSEPEDWGVWSLGPRAEVVLSCMHASASPVEIQIRGRMLIHHRKPRACGRILCNGRPIAEFATSSGPGISIDFRLPAEKFANGEVVLGFEFEMPRSLAEDGISGDTRRLGVGLEEMLIRCPGRP